MLEFVAVLKPLTAALGLSVVVERILEFAKSFFEPFLNARQIAAVPRPANTAEDFQAAKGRLDKEKDPEKIKEALGSLAADERGDVEWGEDVAAATVLVEPATDADNGTTTRALIIQLLGFAAGILLARIANVQLFSSFCQFAAIPNNLTPALDFILTGLFIGGGSGPVHFLIGFLTERKVTVAAGSGKADREAAQPAAPVAAASTPIVTAVAANEIWAEIPYDGGVDREKLERVHYRRQNPSLVVYHHTTMNSASRFEDVVRVIKDRKDSAGNPWITGYHCVVLMDGSIHPFCRWDRYGNHAQGRNLESLGIAFNGNFEPDPSIPYANPAGRLGPVRPSEAQLQAAARVTALWTCLYEDLDCCENDEEFRKKIIPHSTIANKTCPGSAFPHEEFRKWIRFYRERWRAPQYQESIKAYKLKPYLYVR